MSNDFPHALSQNAHMRLSVIVNRVLFSYVFLCEFDIWNILFFKVLYIK